MSDQRLTGKRVLVVEDEFIVSLAVEEILNQAGCITIGPFARVKDALVAASAEVVDVALLDVNVAGEMVFPVAYLLEKKGTPFLFVTGYGKSVLPKDRADWEACTKPFRSTELIESLVRKIESAKHL